MQTSETPLVFQILSVGSLVAGVIWCGGAFWASQVHLYLFGAMHFAVGLGFLLCAYGARTDTSTGQRNKSNRSGRRSMR